MGLFGGCSHCWHLEGYFKDDHGIALNSDARLFHWLKVDTCCKCGDRFEGSPQIVPPKFRDDFPLLGIRKERN